MCPFQNPQQSVPQPNAGGPMNQGPSYRPDVPYSVAGSGMRNVPGAPPDILDDPVNGIYYGNGPGSGPYANVPMNPAFCNQPRNNLGASQHPAQAQSSNIQQTAPVMAQGGNFYFNSR